MITIYISTIIDRKGTLKPIENIDKVLEKIIEGNNIDIDSTELLVRLSENTGVFQVKTAYKNLQIYIVDTVEGARIAAEPEIVGEEFLDLNFKAAIKAINAMKQLITLDRPILFLHILRASLGYMLHEALSSLNIPYSEAFVRVKYEIGSYRDHVQRRVIVPFKKFEGLPKSETTLMVADTVATGLSLEAALKVAYDELVKNEAYTEELILYGFLSRDGIEKIYGTARKLGIKTVYVFAMQDVTPLAYNMYDMPLYGPDESYWSEKGKVKSIGATVDILTLKRMLPEYAPGMDQPGDWSERQNFLFNGRSYEHGNVKGHLEKSLYLLEKLRELTKSTSWYSKWIDKVFEKRHRGLKKALSKL
ncbi:MAG: hypothetical protein DRJ37_06330 [Thermoprotei archaeon]|nr:MAG: hypothetical protein DRJ37_06330 [Thermoprotei archaeon]